MLNQFILVSHSHSKALTDYMIYTYLSNSNFESSLAHRDHLPVSMIVDH